MTRDVVTAIDVLTAHGTMDLGVCSKQTLKNWVNAINEKLAIDNCD